SLRVSGPFGWSVSTSWAIVWRSGPASPKAPRVSRRAPARARSPLVIVLSIDRFLTITLSEKGRPPAAIGARLDAVTEAAGRGPGCPTAAAAGCGAVTSRPWPGSLDPYAVRTGQAQGRGWLVAVLVEQPGGDRACGSVQGAVQGGGDQ